MKISELAKDLNITSKEVIGFLQENGYDYKSPQKILSADEEGLVRKNLATGKSQPAKAEEQVAKEAAPARE